MWLTTLLMLQSIIPLHKYMYIYTINTTFEHDFAFYVRSRVGVNSIPELELQVNSNSRIGIGIEISGIENGIGIETLELELELKTGIELFAIAVTALTS